MSRVTAVVTAVEPAGPDTDHAKCSPLGEILSGWRDLNSRPLDPQIGGDLSVRLQRAWTWQPPRSHRRSVIVNRGRWAQIGPKFGARSPAQPTTTGRSRGENRAWGGTCASAHTRTRVHRLVHPTDRSRGLDQHCGQPLVAVQFPGRALYAGGVVHRRRQLGPGSKMGGGRNRDMSAPVSAMITCATSSPTPGMVCSSSIWCCHGWQASIITASSSAKACSTKSNRRDI